MMVATYKHVEYDTLLLNELVNARAQNNNFDEYVAKYENFRSLVSLSADDFLRIHFTLGLPKRIKDQLVHKRPVTFDEAKTMAMNCWQLNKQEDNLAQINQSNTVSTNDKQKLKQNGKKNEKAKNKTDQNNQSKPKLSCSYCRKTNHVAEKCFIRKRDEKEGKNKNQSEEKAKSNESTERNSRGNRRTRYHNGRSPSRSRNDQNDQQTSQNVRPPNNRYNGVQHNYGNNGPSEYQPNYNQNFVQHVRFDDGKQETSGQRQMTYNVNQDDAEIDFLKTTITIDDINIMAIFDTGAKTSSIPIKIIEQYKIPIQKIVKCQMANNVVEECCLTIPLRTEVLGSISDIQFIGLPRDNVLLGMDWFIENKAIADPCSHAIIFKNRTMYCDTKTKDDNELNVNLTEIDIQDYNAEDIEFYDFPLEAPRDEIDFKINEKLLSSSQLMWLKNFLVGNRHCFARSMQDLKEPCRISQHEITILESKPIRMPQYRKSIEENKIINEEVQKLLDANIIRPSNSPKFHNIEKGFNFIPDTQTA